jgi:GntR family transcriptional repressor for pyruvate dehydrogenase complex
LTEDVVDETRPEQGDAGDNGQERRDHGADPETDFAAWDYKGTEHLQPGDPLPSERELGEQFGVSRTVVREATRALAARGVIEVRVGVGLSVAAVDADTVSSAVRLFMRGSEVALAYAQVHEVLRLVEIEAAGLAARRATEQDLAKLKSCMDLLVDAGTDAEQWARRDVEFHRTVCMLTHNPLHLIMLDAIGDVLLEIRQATINIPGRLPKLIAVHQGIHDAIAAHDEVKARSRMRSHLRELERTWGKLHRPVGMFVDAE